MRVLGLSGVIVFLFSYSAISGLTGGISLDYFSPSYGNINQDLVGINKCIGTDFKFEGGSAFGFSSGYNFTSNWRIRGEFFNFSSKTSDSYEDIWQEGAYLLYREMKVDFEARLGALIFSGIYRFSPDKSFCPYVGIGIGKFSTEFKQEGRGIARSYLNGEPLEHLNIYYSFFDDTSSTGFQFLGGAEYRIGERFVVIGEVRYISAKANEFVINILRGPTLFWGDTEIDWSGLYFGLGVTHFFK